MSPVTAFALSVSMSVDAFTVAVGRGVLANRPRLGEALRTGLVFGTGGAIGPLVGWLLGIVGHDWVASFDHWLAFGILTIVGLKMIHAATRNTHERRTLHRSPSTLMLAAALAATGVDVMAVGLSLALVNVPIQAILTLCLGVGLTTFVCAVAGMMLGKAIGDRAGKLPEIAAGVVICAVGSAILFEHLMA